MFHSLPPTFNGRIDASSTATFVYTWMGQFPFKKPTGAGDGDTLPETNITPEISGGLETSFLLGRLPGLCSDAIR